MLDLFKYLDVLPEEVLVNGEFCVTEIGQKQPYDPFKGYPISAKDQFYSIDKIAEADLEKFDTIGIKVGNGISVIDIDGCVNPHSGELSPVAVEIIDYMKSYTEFSPSGTGIRILFKAKNPFDIDLYKTKNSEFNLEYYDANDQETRGGRMARLSGDMFMPYPFREVDTVSLLEKYMLRTNYGRIAELEAGEISEDWINLVYVLIATRVELKSIMNRELGNSYESDSDLIICNAIAEYTRNPVEINEVFKKTRYYRTKGIRSDKARHKEKWNSDYGWNTIAMANPSVIELEYEPRTDDEVSEEDLIIVGVNRKLLKQFYFRHRKDIDWNKEISKSLEIQALYRLTEMKLNKENIRLKLGGK